MTTRLEIQLNEKRYSFIVTKHFLKRMEDRAPGLTLDKLKDRLLTSFVITDRPTYIIALLNNGIQDAIYLWHQLGKHVFVLEKSREDGIFNAFATLYGASECKWLTRWATTHDRCGRVLFRDFIELMQDNEYVEKLLGLK